MWQSGLRACILPGLPTYLGQELNVGTVGAPASRFPDSVKHGPVIKLQYRHLISAPVDRVSANAWLYKTHAKISRK